MKKNAINFFFQKYMNKKHIFFSYKKIIKNIKVQT